MNVETSWRDGEFVAMKNAILGLLHSHVPCRSCGKQPDVTVINSETHYRRCRPCGIGTLGLESAAEADRTWAWLNRRENHD